MRLFHRPDEEKRGEHRRIDDVGHQVQRVKAQKRPHDGAVSVAVPPDVQGSKLQHANRDERHAEHERHAHPQLKPAQVQPFGRRLREVVGYRRREQHDRVQGPPEQHGSEVTRRPVGRASFQIDVADDEQREHRAFHQHQRRAAPPHDAAVAERVGRQPRDVDRFRFHACSVAGRRCAI